MHGKSYKKGGKAIETENWPKTLSAYKKTPNFTEVTVPKAFLQAHATKEGVWARLHVLEGCLTFFDDVTGAQSLLPPGIHSCIFPSRKHHIAPEGQVRFFVEFCRLDYP
jgi:tellurite resistance-related uncharacterized protein